MLELVMHRRNRHRGKTHVFAVQLLQERLPLGERQTDESLNQRQVIELSHFQRVSRSARKSCISLKSSLE